MRRFLSLLALVALVLFATLPLTACCGDGFVTRSPFAAAPPTPQVVPTQYGIVQPATTYSVVQPVQQVQYAAPAAPVPYTPGYIYAAPPAAGCAPGTGR